LSHVLDTNVIAGLLRGDAPLIERLARAELLREELGTTPWTWEVSRSFGLLKASLEARGQRLDDFDVAIAAHALAVEAVLVTANTKPLGRIEELVLEDWGQ
jgi:tRNA(fMet)-specific endonuclease VapC